MRAHLCRCERCDELFEGRWHGARFCSTTCRRADLDEVHRLAYYDPAWDELRAGSLTEADVEYIANYEGLPAVKLA